MNNAFYACVFAALLFGNAEAYSLDVSYVSPRHAFIRTENPSIVCSVNNQSARELTGVRIEATVDGIGIGTTNNLTFPANSATKFSIGLNTKKLRAGEYKITVSLLDSQAQELKRNAFPFYLSERPKDKMRVWLWPHQKFGDSVQRLDPTALKVLDWYADKGFNSFQPGGDVDHQADHQGLENGKLELFDFALYRDWEMGFSAAGGFNQNVDSPDATFEPLNYSKTKKRFTNPFHPDVIKSQVASNLRIVEQIEDFPAVKTCFFNTEKEDKLPPRLAPGKDRFPSNPGVPHRFVLPGVIPDNDAGYLAHKNRYEWADGLSVANQRAADLIHTFRPDIAVFSDPLRKTVLLDRYRGMDLISTWTYTNPDPKYMLFIETLIANAQPLRKGVMHTITMLNYPGSVAPKKYGWTLMGADRLLETSWINLSRRADRFSIYISSMCDPFNPDTPANIKEAPRAGGHPYQLNPESFEAFKGFSRNVIEPFGPMIKKLERSKRKVAILSSEASRIYSASPRLLGYYDNYQIYCFYSLLNMVHVPTDVVFEETIALHGLDSYDVLVLAKCDTLLESTYKSVLAFQARGGVVVADQYLRAPLPGVIGFDFDFTYRTKVSADALWENESNATFSDYLDERSTSSVATEGVTALDDQKTMATYAKSLRKGLDGIAKRPFDCSTETALLNVLEKDGAQYLFVVNDKRKYGSRFGQYKAILEKNVPQVVTVAAIGRAGQNLHFYDMLEKKEVKTRPAGNNLLFDVQLSSLGGTIIAVLPEKIGGVSIESAKSMDKRCVEYNLDIKINDDKNDLLCGITPLKIEITDPAGKRSELSGYYAADNGKLNIQFIPALNDLAGDWKIRATELISGRSAFRTMRLR